MLHPRDADLFADLKRIAHHTAERFNLRLSEIRPKKCPWGEIYGYCYENNKISIVIRFIGNHGNWLGRLPITEIMDTVAHELAHLKYMDHGRRFHLLYNDILSYLNHYYTWRLKDRYEGGSSPLRLPPKKKS